MVSVVAGHFSFANTNIVFSPYRVLYENEQGFMDALIATL